MVDLPKSFGGVFSRPFHNLVDTTRMLLQVVSNIVHLAAEDNPAALLGLVNCHFLHGNGLGSYFGLFLFDFGFSSVFLGSDSFKIASGRLSRFDPTN